MTARELIELLDKYPESSYNEKEEFDEIIKEFINTKEIENYE